MVDNRLTENRVKYLDGIRGLAIFLVATGHIFYQYYIFKFGWIGLNLFFVLSGYLITQRLYFHYTDNKVSYFKNFYLRRVVRIFPLYYGCLFIFFIILPFFYPPYFIYYGDLYKAQGWYWGYASNWMMIFKGLPAQSVFFHFWSLAVEEQFYLFWPFLFLLLINIKRSYVFVLLLITGSIIVRISIHENLASYLNTLTAAEPLFLGALVAILEKEKKLESWYNFFLIMAIISLIGLGIIFMHDSNLHFTNSWLLRAGYSTIDFIWIFILVHVSTNRTYSPLIRRLFDSKWLTWLGKYSYGIYVFHWIILILFIYKAEHELIRMGFEKQLIYFTVRIIGIAFILAISYASYNLFERKFLRLKKYFI